MFCQYQAWSYKQNITEQLVEETGMLYQNITELIVEETGILYQNITEQ